MQNIFNIILFILLSSPVFSQTCTKTGTCNMWRAAWTEDGELNNYQPNEEEITIINSIKTKAEDNVHVVMVRQDMTYTNQKRYYVLFEVLDSEGNVINRIGRDLSTFKEWHIN